MRHNSNSKIEPRADSGPASGDAVDKGFAGSGEWWWLLFVGVMTIVFCAPFFRLGFFVPDEGVYLHGAERLLQGRKIYVDFFEFLPPGSFLITAGWFALTGVSFASARCLAILTIAGIACLTYLACRQVTKHAASSALVALGWVVMSQGIWTQINHHWFTTLFSMGALCATLAAAGNSRWMLRGSLIAGLTAGAAAMVTQTRGALVMLAAATVFVNVRRPRLAVAYVCASLVVPMALLCYVIGQGALEAAYDNIIRFPASHYATFQGVPYGEHADVRNFPLVVLFPLTALLALLTSVREWHSGHHDPLLRPCIAFAIAGFIGFFPRMDGIHIAFAAPLVCPLFVHCIKRLIRDWRPTYRVAAVGLIIALCLPSLYGFLALYEAPRHLEIVSTPRGSMRISDEVKGLDRLITRIAATAPQDAYFFYPFAPTLSFLTDRRHASKYDVFTPPGYPSPGQYQETCIAVMRRAAWIVIERRMTDPTWLNWLFPALRGAYPPAAQKFERALEKGFVFAAREGVFEMHRRAEWVDEAVCSGIAE